MSIRQKLEWMNACCFSCQIKKLWSRLKIWNSDMSAPSFGSHWNHAWRRWIPIHWDERTMVVVDVGDTQAGNEFQLELMGSTLQSTMDPATVNLNWKWKKKSMRAPIAHKWFLEGENDIDLACRVSIRFETVHNMSIITHDESWDCDLWKWPTGNNNNHHEPLQEIIGQQPFSLHSISESTLLKSHPQTLVVPR